MLSVCSSWFPAQKQGPRPPHSAGRPAVERVCIYLPNYWNLVQYLRYNFTWVFSVLDTLFLHCSYFMFGYYCWWILDFQIKIHFFLPFLFLVINFLLYFPFYFCLPFSLSLIHFSFNVYFLFAPLPYSQLYFALYHQFTIIFCFSLLLAFPLSFPVPFLFFFNQPNKRNYQCSLHQLLYVLFLTFNIIKYCSTLLLPLVFKPNHCNSSYPRKGWSSNYIDESKIKVHASTFRCSG